MENEKLLNIVQRKKRKLEQGLNDTKAEIQLYLEEIEVLKGKQASFSIALATVNEMLKEMETIELCGDTNEAVPSKKNRTSFILSL